jgi:hypothetical protein
MQMHGDSKIEAVAGAAQKAKALCDNPTSFFNHSYTEMQSIPREDLNELQLEGVKYRFDALRDRIPILQKLADSQAIENIEAIHDVVPLLFEHTMVKSYPPSLLEHGRFSELNRFLAKLVTFDLSDIDVSGCKSIDDWMDTMDRESPLHLVHSSGSTGTMSFMPFSKREWDKFGETQRITCLQTFGTDPVAADEDEDEIYVIFPYFRYAGAGMIRQCENFLKYIAGSEDRLLTAYPGRMSSDLLYLAAKIQSAQSKGALGRLKIAPELLARKAEYEKLLAEMPEHLEAFLNNLAVKLKGKRIFYSGPPSLWVKMVEAAQAKGLHRLFAPNSVIVTGGGGAAKGGVKMPDDWQQQICELVGIEKLLIMYGMTEVLGLHLQCEQGHYHFAPWTVPFVLDPDTSKVLPRDGRVTGRAAFFDLGAETHWGGFISGDEYTVNWSTPCPCGRSTVYAEDDIQRLSVKRGGDDKISCAATEGAHKEAMSFLLELG